MAQVLRPASDIVLGEWLPSDGGSPTELWPLLDETSPADADYAYTENESTFEVGLSAGTDPASSTGHIVRYRLQGDGTHTLQITLLDNSASPPIQVAQWSETSPPPSTTPLEYSYTLTSGEADSILDYSALSLRFEVVASGTPTETTFGDNTGNTTGTEDTYLFEASPTLNFGTNGSLESGPTLIRFDLSSLVGATITDAYLSMQVSSGSAASDTLTVRRCLRAWVESEATWNEFSSGNGWGTAGAQGDGTDRDASASATISYPGGFDTSRIDSTSNTKLIEDIQDIADGGSNNGWVIDFAVGQEAYDSSESTDGDRPTLVVNYIL